MKKLRDFSALDGKHRLYPISHGGYAEVRFTSDSESEFPFSDDDDVANVFYEHIQDNNDPTTECKPVISLKRIPSDSNPAKPNSSSPTPVPSLSGPCVDPIISKHHEVNVLDSDFDNDNGQEEINGKPSNQKLSSSDLPELISLDDVSPLHIAVKTADGESEDTLNVTQASGTGVIAEKHMEDSKKIDTMEKVSTISDSAPVCPRQENSSNMSKSPVSIKESEVPDSVIKQPTTDEVGKVKEELELMPSNTPIVSVNHIQSPEVHSVADSSNEMQALQKSPSVESGLEYLDEFNTTEIEGESIIDRWQRQIEYDKKCLAALQKEQEEERNASAIATNEAMSMITRLPEEKAALQMEALQYLRMMEEQEEYDNDELDKVNDLLTEKEKEIQDLEAELEYYKLNMTDEPMVHSMQEESCDFKHESVRVQEVVVHNESCDLKGR